MIHEQALKERLKTLAKAKDIRFNVAWKQLILERFLVRLSKSTHADKFIFKGGYLLAYFINIGRETTDLDFLLTRMKAEVPLIREAIESLVSEKYNDGFIFVFDSIKLLSQPHMDYPGYRVNLRTTFGNMRDKIQVDIGVGDVVEPEVRELKLFEYKGKSFFEDEISLQVYPLETIFAEKLETILSKGAANSRMKDYHDLFLLTHELDIIDKEKLLTTIEKTFQNRGTAFQSIKFDNTDLSGLQRLWRAHYKGLGKIAEALKLPQEMEEVIATINHFL
ncbi:hypothetical protein SCG7109_AH_00200 [Chlamydiales bacterium SCGC AG-110-M15]|nr:hypothetical protein SCG7109_AH_00200 [Chlamydiales bacterium SCGC AG-110-M15]